MGVYLGQEKLKMLLKYFNIQHRIIHRFKYLIPSEVLSLLAFYRVYKCAVGDFKEYSRSNKFLTFFSLYALLKWIRNQTISDLGQNGGGILKIGV